MLHYCRHCEYKSNHKHKQHQNQSQSRAHTSMSVVPNTQYAYGGSTSHQHQHVSNPHPYVHPYLSHANQQVSTYPQPTPYMIANNLKYAEETRAPTKISVSPNGPTAPSTVSVPSQREGVEQFVNPTNHRGGGIGDQFHRPSQNSIHGERHDPNNRAPTKYQEPGPTVRTSTSVSVPTLRSQHEAGIDETMDFITNDEEEDNIWDIITNIHGELEYIQNLKNNMVNYYPR